MEERIMILKMLEAGKISSEEAMKLLDAIDKKTPKENSKDESTSYKKKVDDNINDFSEKAERIAEQFGEQFGINAEKFAEDFSKRVENVSTDIANAAVKLTDKMMKYFNTAVNTTDNRYEMIKTYNFKVQDLENLQIKLNTSNFSVKADGADTDSIQVNIITNSFMQDISIDDCFSAIFDGAKFNIITQFPNRTWGKINITVPKKLFSIQLNTANAKCEVSNINCDQIGIITSNSKIDMRTCAAHHVEALTDNGKIEFERCGLTNLSARTSNGRVEFKNCRIDEMIVKTSNASIALNEIYKLNEAEGKYNVFSSNGRIDIDITSDNECGYLVDAHTTMGKININLPNLSYAADKRDFSMNSEASLKSANYDELTNRLNIRAETSNASINIKNR